MRNRPQKQFLAILCLNCTFCLLEFLYTRFTGSSRYSIKSQVSNSGNASWQLGLKCFPLRNKRCTYAYFVIIAEVHTWWMNFSSSEPGSAVTLHIAYMLVGTFSLGLECGRWLAGLHSSGGKEQPEGVGTSVWLLSLLRTTWNKTMPISDNK